MYREIVNCLYDIKHGNQYAICKIEDVLFMVIAYWPFNGGLSKVI